MDFLTDFNLSPPLLMNLWKHHLKYIQSQISQFTQTKEIEKLNKTLLILGDSQMDMYVGDLLPHKIGEEILAILAQKELLARDKYEQWLETKNGYQLISIADTSNWTLRLGNIEGYFVHIHPSRYANNTIRVKANALKTAILAITWAGIENRSPFSLDVINYVRTHFLAESPLQKIDTQNGIGKIISFLINS